MEILIGTPIILIYEHGVCTSNDQLYYLGMHCYGRLTDKGFKAIGIIDEAKYVVPFTLWNFSYMHQVKGIIDKNRFLKNHKYEDFLVSEVQDIDDGHLNEFPWWHEITKPSIEYILDYYGTELK